jgi:outer membrane lipoprotein-sorting protein
MKRFVPLILAVVVLATALMIGSPKGVHGQSAGLVSSVLNRMERNRKSLTSLRAVISMEKYNAQLRDAERYNGIVLYAPSGGREASVRIEWRSPQLEILAVSNGQYTLFRPRLGMAYKGSAKSNRNKAGGVMEMMYMSRQQLESRFQPVQDVREETLWGGVSTIHLTLIPKGNAKTDFKYAEIWVDSSGMPVQTKIVEKNDDATTMRLRDLEKNVPISSGEFTVKLDSNVRIVKG